MGRTSLPRRSVVPRLRGARLQARQVDLYCEPEAGTTSGINAIGARWCLARSARPAARKCCRLLRLTSIGSFRTNTPRWRWPGFQTPTRHLPFSKLGRTDQLGRRKVRHGCAAGSRPEKKGGCSSWTTFAHPLAHPYAYGKTLVTLNSIAPTVPGGAWHRERGTERGTERLFRYRNSRLAIVIAIPSSYTGTRSSCSDSYPDRCPTSPPTRFPSETQ